MQNSYEYIKKLTYPFDSALITRKIKRIKKELLQQDNLMKKRIAVLGGSTTQQAVDYLEVFLLAEGILPIVYQSDYARFWEDAVFGTPDFDSFSPDLIVIHTNVRNLNALALRDEDYDQITSLEEDKKRFSQVWNALSKKFSCPIIQNNFERPPYRLLGNQDICDKQGIGQYVFEMNQHLYSYAQKHPTFFVHDLDFLAAQYGLSNWHDLDVWCAYKIAFSLGAMPEYSYSLSRVICSLFGKRRKVLVSDLDNTLWSGIVGDEGPEGIVMGPDTPEGEKYRYLQTFIYNLRKTGIVLAVNSKNDEDVALEGLNHTDSILPARMFASIQTNWQPKSANIDVIADELSLGSDSFVFLDDNPAEREIVAQVHPEVSLVEFVDIGEVPGLIDQAGFFEVTSLTADDFKRADQYRENAQRRQAEKSFTDYDAYLDSLEMEASNVGFSDTYVSRVTQLVNKTNQFNLTTRRCTEDEIRAYAQDSNTVCLALTLEDKFGDNGLVSVVIGVINGTVLNITLWLMSCRVLKRGLEDLTFNLLLQEAQDRDLKSISGTYIPTKRNGMVKDLYEHLGFERTSEDGSGKTTWTLNLENTVFKKTHIKLI